MLAWCTGLSTQNLPNSQVSKMHLFPFHSAPNPMCTFQLWMLYCGICSRCIVGFVRLVHRRIHKCRCMCACAEKTLNHYVKKNSFIWKTPSDMEIHHGCKYHRITLLLTTLCKLYHTLIQIKQPENIPKNISILCKWLGNIFKQWILIKTNINNVLSTTWLEYHSLLCDRFNITY